MSVLRVLASRVTAADLQTPLGPTLALTDTVADAEAAVLAPIPPPNDWSRLGEDPADRLCLVTSPDGHTTHVVNTLDLYGADQTVAEVAEPILPEDCIAADTPALQLAKFFSGRSRRWALVLTNTRLTGGVTQIDLWKPEFSICVLALLLEVEQRCAEALANDEEIDNIWASLTPNRQAKAMEVFAARKQRAPSTAPPGALVFCTTFADKAGMLSRLPSFANFPKSRLRSEFRTMERFRNLLAHSGASVVQDLEELTAVIDAAEATLKRLKPREEAAIRLVKSDT